MQDIQQLDLNRFCNDEVPMFNWFQCRKCKNEWISHIVNGEYITHCPECGTGHGEVSHMGFCAGADGKTFNKKGADRVGMLPNCFREKYGHD